MFTPTRWSRFTVHCPEIYLLGGFVSANRPDVFKLSGLFHDAVLDTDDPVRRIATQGFHGLMVDAIKFQQEGFGDKPEIQFRTLGGFKKIRDNGEDQLFLIASDFRLYQKPQVVAFPRGQSLTGGS